MSTNHATFSIVMIIFIMVNGLAMLCLTEQTTAAGREIYVDDSFVYPRDGTAANPYQTISEAITRANDGDSIYVFSGTYNETVIVNKRVSLIGGIDDKPSILSRGIELRYLVDITTDFVRFENFFLEDPGRFITSQSGALVHIAANNVVFEKNTISHCDLWGIYLDSSSYNTISGNIINDTKGIYVYSSNSNLFSNNKISNASDAGVNMRSSKANILYQNYFTTSTYGIYEKACSNNNITKNTIIKNGFHGIFTTENNNDVIQGNFFRNNSISAITLDSIDCIIADNIFDRGQVGLSIQKTGCHVYGNSFQNLSATALSTITGSSDNIIYLNRFFRNSVNAREQGSNQWDNGTIGNYWDSYNYVDRNLDGIGDLPFAIPNGGLDRFPAGVFLKPPQKPSSPSPADDKENVGLKVTLWVKVVDSDSKIISEVSFYNAVNDLKIGTARNIPSGTNASCSLTLPFDTTYAWYTIANDSLLENKSDIWFFTTKQVSPENEKPVANPGGPYTTRLAQPTFFNGSLSFDPDGTIIFYRWNFGDGSNQILGKTATHTYDEPGVYMVTLTVVDNDGRSSMKNTTTTIKSSIDTTPPVVIIFSPATPKVDDQIHFTASLNDDTEGTIIGYRWDFNSDGVYDTDWLTTPVSTYTFSSPGSYVVTLQVKDTLHVVSSTTTTVFIAEAEQSTPGFEIILVLGAVIISLFFYYKRYNSKL